MQFLRIWTDNSIGEYRADCYCFCQLQRVCQLRGWQKDTPKNKETYDLMMEIWTGLRSKADKDNDGQVSLESFHPYSPSPLSCKGNYMSSDSVFCLAPLSVPKVLKSMDCTRCHCGSSWQVCRTPHTPGYPYNVLRTDKASHTKNGREIFVHKFPFLLVRNAEGW